MKKIMRFFRKENVGSSEKLLLDVLKTISEREDISLEDNIFNIGMDSLASIHFLRELNEVFSIELTLEELYFSENFNELLEIIAKKPKFTPSLLQEVNACDFVASTRQKNTWNWVVNNLENNSFIEVNVQEQIKINSVLDKGVLFEVLSVLKERHKLLESEFYEKDGELYIKYGSVEVLPQIYSGKSDGEIFNIMYSNLIRAFDLRAKEPLVRIKVFERERDFIICFCAHHIISDGNSLGVFFLEFVLLYHSLLVGNRDVLGKQPIDFRIFCEYHNDVIARKKNELLEFWNQLYSTENPSRSFFALSRNAVRPRPLTDLGIYGRNQIELSPEKYGELKTYCQSNKLPFLTALITAFQLSLISLTKEYSHQITVPFSGRPSEKFNNVFGFFANTLVIPFKSTENKPYQELLVENKKLLSQAAENQMVCGLDFSELSKTNYIKKQSSDSIVFSFLDFSYASGYQSSGERGSLFFRLGDVEITRYDGPSAMRADLIVTAVAYSDALFVNFEYDSKMIDEVQVKQLSQAFIENCESFTG